MLLVGSSLPEVYGVCWRAPVALLQGSRFVALSCLPLSATVVLQLTDVDPPYGKAPTAQLADKLAGEGTAGAELFDGPREMVLETQVGKYSWRLCYICLCTACYWRSRR
jgi:hypothetical protein